MTSTPFEQELVLVRRNPGVLAVAGQPFVGALVLAFYALTVAPREAMAIPYCLVAGVLAMLYAWRRNFLGKTDRVLVKAEARGLTVGARLIPRSRIRAGFVLPGRGRSPRVLLRLRLGLPVELQMGNREEARALLRALGLDVSQRVADFRLLSRARADPLGAFGLSMGFMVLGVVLATAVSSIARGLGPAFLVVPALLLAAMMVVPTRLRVGADGLEIRWMGTHRFERYDDIARVVRYEKGFGRSRVIGLEVSLRSGQTLRLPVQDRSWDSDQIGLVEERIREAREGLRAGDTVSDAARLERGTRGMKDWVAELQAIGAGANVTLRTAPLPKDRLLRVVEDASLRSASRAAAAVALVADLDDDARARLRVVAESTAEPLLRVALERAAGGASEAELEEVLAEVSREPFKTAAAD